MPQSGLSRASKPAWDAEREMFGIWVAEVIAVNWEDHTVDLRTPNGASLAHVPIATPWAGSDYGDVNRAHVSADRETHALVAFTKGLAISPVVLGFFFPETSQMMLDGFQRITRHVGDTFSAVSMDGDVWLAFSPDGSYVGFHNDNPSPPIVYGTDYDRKSAPDGGKDHSFSVMLRNGTHVHLDGASGNIVVNAAKYLQMEAHEQLDLFGRVVTIQGLPAVYPGGSTGLVAAPSTADPAIVVAHVTSNAAYDYIPPIAATGPNGEGLLKGWTYLTHAPASRVEIAPDGKLRTFAAPLGLVGEAIVWTEVPQGGVSPYIVPPDQSLSLTFSTVGDQTTPYWIAGYAATFNDHEVEAAASGTTELQLNGVGVPYPTIADPLAVVRGDRVRLLTSGTSSGTHECDLTIIANPSALPDVALWFTVDPSTDPPTVTPPA